MNTIPRDVIRLQGLASKDPGRYNITGVCLQDGLAVATNGHALAVRHYEANGYDKSIVKFSKSSIPAKHEHVSFDDAGRGMGVDLTADVVDRGATWTDAASGETVQENVNFPNWAEVVPSNHHFTLCLDVNLLVSLADAMGRDTKAKPFFLTLQGQVNERSVVTTPVAVSAGGSGTCGIIMPAKEDDAGTPIEYLRKLLK